MSAPVGRPTFIPCGRCRASTALEWAPIGDGDWSGMGRCPACGAGVLSIFSESGIPLDDVASILRAIPDGEALAEVSFGASERPKKGGSATLIA